MHKIQNYINGQYLDPVNTKWLDNVNPATGHVISHLPNSDQKDVDLAVAAAKEACRDWSLTSGSLRFKILKRIPDYIAEKKQELAVATTNDT